MPRPSGTCAIPAARTRSGEAPGSARRESDLARLFETRPRDGAQRRRLARAVAAEDGHDLALVDPQRDAVQRLDLAVARLDVLELEQRRISRPSRGTPRSPRGRAARRPACRRRSSARSRAPSTVSEIRITRPMWCSTRSTVSRTLRACSVMSVGQLLHLLVAQAAGRLVEEQELRPRDEGARELDPLQGRERQPETRALRDAPDLEDSSVFAGTPLGASRAPRRGRCPGRSWSGRARRSGTCAPSRAGRPCTEACGAGSCPGATSPDSGR